MTAVNTYDVGDLVRLSATFTDAAGQYCDPTVVCFSVLPPSQSIGTTYTYGTDPEVVKDSQGHYHMDINITDWGIWHYRAYATGTGQGAEHWKFVVSPSPA